ncbi:uncharacterized protein [Dermacentor albipictus]|uniref:uncharacterized protein n=1 Tax=Dermacentor albipictus TaxID=60249 RepID=UPI0038FC7833
MRSRVDIGRYDTLVPYVPPKPRSGLAYTFTCFPSVGNCWTGGPAHRNCIGETTSNSKNLFNCCTLNNHASTKATAEKQPDDRVLLCHEVIKRYAMASPSVCSKDNAYA